MMQHDYYGYDQDWDDDAPTLILECAFCMAEIPFLGDEQAVDGTVTLGECHVATCPRCDAIYGEGDVLTVIQEEHIAPGTCPWCSAPSHAKACAPLAALLMDGDASRDALLDRLVELEGVL